MSMRKGERDDQRESARDVECLGPCQMNACVDGLCMHASVRAVHTMIRQPHEAASIVHPYQVWAQRECSRPVINIASSHRSNISVSFQLRTCIGFRVFGLEVRVSASFQVRTCIHVCCVCVSVQV
jgi:hypothetical protein